MRGVRSSPETQSGVTHQHPAGEARTEERASGATTAPPAPSVTVRTRVVRLLPVLVRHLSDLLGQYDQADALGLSVEAHEDAAAGAAQRIGLALANATTRELREFVDALTFPVLPAADPAIALPLDNAR